MALAGIVPTKVTIANGSIKAGDLLTTSSKPGYAMKCNDLNKCKGAIIGKAMESISEDGCKRFGDVGMKNKTFIIFCFFLIVFVLLSNPSLSLSLNDGLVLHLRFDEGGGTKVYDSSGFGNDGTLYNGSIVCAGQDCPNWVNGKFGKALEFNGVDDYVDVNGSGSLTGSRTIVAWVFVSSPSSIGSLGLPVVVEGISGAGQFYSIGGTASGAFGNSLGKLFVDRWVGVLDKQQVIYQLHLVNGITLRLYIMEVLLIIILMVLMLGQ